MSRRFLASRLLASRLLAAALVLMCGGVRAGDDICDEAGKRFAEVKGGSPVSGEPAVVLLYNYTFCPRDLRVKAGSTLRFVNVDRRTSHSVWFRDAGRAESERFFPGEHVDVVIDLPPGSHEVLCGPHWEHQAMRGRVTVEP